MAELTVASLVLSPIIKKMLDKALSYSESQYNRQKDMSKNFEKLVDILIQIQIVVDRGEHLQSMDASDKRMLCHLKDAICEAGNLVDAFGYQIKEAQAMEGGGIVSHARRLIGPNKLANRLKEILPWLDSVRQTAHTFNAQVLRFKKEIVPDRVTSSMLPTGEICGRAKEKEEVINLLLKGVDEPESSHTDVSVIVIVGDGGIGKTTLAQLVYADKRINDKFYGKWICVSENFDKSKLTIEISECMSNGRNKDITNFNDLQKELQMKIRSKRFLLVLDDVWIKEDNKAGSNVEFFNQEIWKTLLAPLKDNKKGSKILVTTRMKIVANVIGATSFPLKGLPDNETWSLLKRHAFGNEIPYNSSVLEKIGQQNIKRLDGSPLAAKVVGSMLKDKLDAKSWSEILGSRIYDDTMGTLQLSYQYLPDHLRYCFAFCSIFPKHWKFEPKNLVLLWIAEGYVLPDRTGRSLRDIGMDYFHQLLSRSLFEKVGQHYVMHDLINDLAQYVSEDECFRIHGGKQEKISETVKHLGIVATDVVKLRDIFTRLGKMSNLKKLRTLMLFGNARFSHADLPLDILKELKSLRVLDFGISLTSQFPKTLCHCLYLRYLNLGPYFSGILPKSLSKLYHLQVLSAGQLPLSQNMFRLLKFGEPKFLAVQRLEFKVKRKSCHRIGVLKNMGMEIRAVEGNLCIMNLENVTNKAEAAEADLGSKQYLDGLELHWDSSSARINGHDAKQIAQALKPHPNLELLTIKGFLGKRCPNWLESKWLHNLRSLDLIDCSDLEVLPPLDRLPLLKKCTVKGCPKLMSFPPFPHTLEEIEISKTGLIPYLSLSLRSQLSPECFELTTTGISSHTALLHDHHLQAIQYLSINDCKEPMLAKWLLRFAALKELDIDNSNEWLMSEEEEEDGGGILPLSLESLNISDCPVTERWLSRCLQGLTSLKYLRFWNCPELKSLPQEVGGGVLATSLEILYIQECPVTDLSVISHCPSLKILAILNCPELKSLSEENGGGVLATSLESLQMSECPVTDLSLISPWPPLKILIVKNCRGLKSLPQEVAGGVLATSLESLEISECPVTDLSWISHCPSLESLRIENCPVTDLSWISHCTSLNTLEIEDCPELKSLLEEVGGSVLLSSLEFLVISKCPVTDLSLISHCPSLKHLTVKNCSELKSLPQEDGCGVLATSLETFHISKCSVTDLSLISHCTSLKRLIIEDCPELKSLPEEGLPTSLKSVHFVGCGVPKESVVRCLQGLPSLSSLTVDFWTHLTALPSLCHLEIKSCRCEPNSKVELPQALPSLAISKCVVSDTFLSTCLQGLTSLSELKIQFCNELTSLPSAQVLHRLTALQMLNIRHCNELTSLGALHALASLKDVIVLDCPKLKSLPKEGLPSSMKYLILPECHPTLKQQIHEKKGPDWDKVAHIPYIGVC